MANKIRLFNIIKEVVYMVGGRGARISHEKQGVEWGLSYILNCRKTRGPWATKLSCLWYPVLKITK